MRRRRALSVAYGLTIASEISVPGAMSAANDEVAQLEIDFGLVPEWRALTAWGPYRIASADLFEFVMPGVATFTCRNRRRITITPDKAAESQMIGEMLIATALPALMWARGEVIIHAGAAVEPDATHGFIVAGPSGSGKSTHLVRALASGARIIGDDSVRLRLEGGKVMASGLPGCLFQRYGADADRRVARLVPDGYTVREYPVDRLMVLEQRQGDRERPGGIGTLAALLRHRHRPRIALLLGFEPTMLEGLASLACALQPMPDLHDKACRLSAR